MTTPSLVLDRFTNLQPIDSKHGSIQIYRALHIHRYADVLLKVASRSPGDSIADLIEAQNRICVEALVTQLVNHPHVVRVIDASTGPTLNTFVALEFLDGQDLASHLELAAPLSVTHALELAIPIAQAIEATHRAGVIHGDIKPSNIMLVHGTPTLVDFGCAFSPLIAAYRPVGQPTGTYGYMCPRYRATATLTERSDIFSFGVVLYEMLTGINPFAEEARSHISETFVVQSKGARRTKRARRVPLLTEIAPQVPPELAREIHRAIARNPDRRHSSMAELLAALESNLHRLSHFQPITLERTGDDYATAGCGIPALTRALDILAEEHSPPTCSGQGMGFDRGFFAGARRPKALEASRSLPALMAHQPASSLQAVFTGKADASPLLKVKARDQAVTVPGVDTNGLAVCSATFTTLGCGTMARPTVVIRSSLQKVDMGGPDTLPFVSCPDGISHASRQTLADGASLRALGITVDPAAAIRAAMASEADTPVPDAVVRALETATPTPVRSLRSRPQLDKDPFATLPTGTMMRSPAPLRAHARSIAVTGPDTRPLGTLIVCSPRTTTRTQVAVAHKLEAETTVAEPVPVPESAKLAVSAAVRIAPARTVPSEAASTPSAHKLVLLSSPSKPSAPSSKAALKDARVYAGVPVRRPRQLQATLQGAPRNTVGPLPFATILAERESLPGRRMASVCAGAAMTLALVFGAFSVGTVELPTGTAKSQESAVFAPPVVPDAVSRATDARSLSPVPTESPSTPATSIGITSEAPKSGASVPRPAGAAAPKQSPAANRHNDKRCPPGVHSPACAAPLLARYDVDEYRPAAKRLQPDPEIIDPWAGSMESVPSMKRKGRSH